MPKSFIDIDAVEIIRALKQTLLGRGLIHREDNKSLILTLMPSISYHGYDQTGNNKIHEERTSKRCYSFIMSHDTLTWVYKYPSSAHGYLNEIELDDIEFLSSHDSCWIDAIGSYLSQERQDMYRLVTEHVPEKERPAPVQLHQDVRFAWSNPIKFALIDWTTKKVNDERFSSYIPCITKIKPLDIDVNNIFQSAES